ncbi:hypothetical protein EDB19DRAFT_1699265 [Suillus lakei]|nr:hypothetical protein EDB19DRAFT_1699265 [Suillus lakei]
MSTLTKAWSWIAALVAAAAALQGTLAQIVSNITCLDAFDWMNNAHAQDPCLVAAYLGSPCNAGNFEIDPIPVGAQYVGPSLNGANPCQCNTITYSLTSACGVCQGGTAVSWSSWKFNCSTSFIQLYPETIPTGTSIQNWAYLDVVTSNSFNITAVGRNGDLPESNATNPLSTSIPTSTTSSVSSTAAPSKVSSMTTSGTSTGSSTPTSSSLNVGATVGGVIGGVVGVGAVASLAAWFFIRRRRSRAAGALVPAFNNQPEITQPLRTYDPADSSTFPPPFLPAIPTTASSNTRTSQLQITPYQLRPGQYSGFPEV